MANNENLIPMNKRTKSEQRAITTSGGIASGESRRKRKFLKEAFETLLSSEITLDLAAALNEKVNALGIDTSEFTVNDYIALAQVINAVQGDSKSFEIIRDTIGQKPVEKVIVSDIDASVIDEVERMVNNDEATSG